MLDASIDDEAVAHMGIEDLTTDIDADGAADDIDELMMRMTVAGADPVRVKVVADEHELIGIGEHLAAHAGLRGKGLWVLGLYEAHVFS
jgi:hypothetical protein